MSPGLMCWVWIFLPLAHRIPAESHRCTRGRLTGQHEPCDGLERLFDTAQQAPTDGSFPAPVWSFIQSSGKSPEMPHFDQAQYLCSNGTISLRFSLIRYSNFSLEDGMRLLSLRGSSVHIHRGWVMVKFPYTGCHTVAQIGDGIALNRLKLHYFDRLLQKNMTGMAVCQNPVESQQTASPLVICRRRHL